MSDFENEEWRPVSIAPEYQVSDHGRVKRTKVLSPMGGSKMKGGRIRPPYVRLCSPGRKWVDAKVIDLVAAAFLGDPSPGYRADYKSSDRLNMHVSNIHYVSNHDYWLKNKRRAKLVYLTKPKRVKPPKAYQPKRMLGEQPTPEESAMIAALQAQERRDKAAALADRIKRATIMRERQEANRLAELKREERKTARLITRQIREAERQEDEERKAAAKRNTRPTVAPRLYTGNRNAFAPIWSETPLTIGLRMEGRVAILTDRDGKSRRVEPGDLIMAYAGRILRRKKARPDQPDGLPEE